MPRKRNLDTRRVFYEKFKREVADEHRGSFCHQKAIEVLKDRWRRRGEKIKWKNVQRKAKSRQLGQQQLKQNEWNGSPYDFSQGSRHRGQAAIAETAYVKRSHEVWQNFTSQSLVQDPRNEKSHSTQSSISHLQPEPVHSPRVSRISTLHKGTFPDPGMRRLQTSEPTVHSQWHTTSSPEIDFTSDQLPTSRSLFYSSWEEGKKGAQQKYSSHNPLNSHQFELPKKRSQRSKGELNSSTSTQNQGPHRFSVRQTNLKQNLAKRKGLNSEGSTERVLPARESLSASTDAPKSSRITRQASVGSSGKSDQSVVRGRADHLSEESILEQPREERLKPCKSNYSGNTKHRFSRGKTQEASERHTTLPRCPETIHSSSAIPSSQNHQVKQRENGTEKDRSTQLDCRGQRKSVTLTDVGPLELLQNRRDLPALLNQSVKKTGALGPNLNAARRVHPPNKVKDVREARVLKPTIRELISSTGSQRKLNCRDLYQEARTRRLQREKGMPRFGIEMVSSPARHREDAVVEEDEAVPLEEGFHWDSIIPSCQGPNLETPASEAPPPQDTRPEVPAGASEESSGLIRVKTEREDRYNDGKETSGTTEEVGVSEASQSVSSGRGKMREVRGKSDRVSNTALDPEPKDTEQIVIPSRDAGPLELLQNRRDLPALLNQSVKKTGALGPNLNAARRVHPPNKVKDVREARVLKPTIRELISSTGSQRKLNCRDLYQEAQKRKLQKEKGMPRFGIEMVSSPARHREDAVVEEDEAVPLEEGFHWDSIIPSCQGPNLETPASVAPPPQDTRPEVPAGESEESSGLIRVKTEREDRYNDGKETSGTTEEVGVSEASQSVSSGRGKMREVRSKSDRVSNPALDPEPKDTEQIVIPSRAHVSELLAVSLKEEELSRSLEDVNSKLVQGHATLQAAYLELQRLLLVKEQISTELDFLRTERVDIVHKIQDASRS